MQQPTRPLRALTSLNHTVEMRWLTRFSFASVVDVNSLAFLGALRESTIAAFATFLGVPRSVVDAVDLSRVGVSKADDLELKTMLRVVADYPTGANQKIAEQ